MNKTALITGGSRGIGFGIAKVLAEKGWDLAINGMREESAVGEILEELRGIGSQVIYCRGNIGDSEDRTSMIHQVIEHFGHLTALVNNAGVAPKERKDLLDMSEESFDRVMGINLKGSFFLSQLAAKEMIKTKAANPAFNGFIINMSSISATVVSPNRGQYCMSKAGMSMMTQLLATRLAEDQIFVYEIRPGIIVTDMTSTVKEKYDKLFSEGLAVQKRWGFPEDVGKAVGAMLEGNFLYSPGQVIMVEGGMTIPRL